MQLNLKYEKTLEELKEHYILKDLRNQFLVKFIENLKSQDYKFLSEYDIYFYSNKMEEERKKFTLLLEKELKSNEPIIIRNNYSLFKLYKKRDGEKEELNDIAISIYSCRMIAGAKEFVFEIFSKSPALFFFRDDGIFRLFQDKGYLLTSFKKLADSFYTDEEKINKKIFYDLIKFKSPECYLWKELKEADFEYIFINFTEVFCCQTKQQLIEKMFNKKIKFNLNKLDFRLGVSLAYFLEFIEERDHQKFYEFCKEIEDFDIEKKTAKYKRRKIYILSILTLFFEKRLKEKIDDCNKIILFDYIKMSIDINEKISLLRTSMKKIKEKHDDLTLKSRLKYYKVRLKIHKKYKLLELPKEYILLKTTKNIVQEGIEQNHCVASYIPAINNGRCVIYTTIYNDIKYTLEIVHTPRKGYVLRQIQGYSNNIEVPVELREKTVNLLIENNKRIKFKEDK